MAIMEAGQTPRADNPLDILEELVNANEWRFDRSTDEEMVVEIAGRWCEYRLFFVWQQDLSAMYFSCLFDLRAPPQKRTAVAELLALVNEKMWLGHFDLWSEDGLPIFRHAMLLRGTQGATAEQIEDMVNVALSESERFYPAFQFVIWGGKPPEEAVAAALIDPIGEA